MPYDTGARRDLSVRVHVNSCLLKGTFLSEPVPPLYMSFPGVSRGSMGVVLCVVENFYIQK